MRRSFLGHLISKALISSIQFNQDFLRFSKQALCFPAIKEDEGDRQQETRDLYHLNLFAKLIVLLSQILLAITTIAGMMLRRISAEQVPSLLRIAPKYLKLVASSNFWPFSNEEQLVS